MERKKRKKNILKGLTRGGTMTESEEQADILSMGWFFLINYLGDVDD